MQHFPQFWCLYPKVSLVVLFSQDRFLQWIGFTSAPRDLQLDCGTSSPAISLLTIGRVTHKWVKSSSFHKRSKLQIGCRIVHGKVKSIASDVTTSSKGNVLSVDVFLLRLIGKTKQNLKLVQSLSNNDKCSYVNILTSTAVSNELT